MVLLLPTFNEEECISAVLDDALAACRPHGHRILVVDDGSSDATAARVRAHPGHPDSVDLLPLAHGGKDAALWAGIEAAQDEWIGMMDADGQYDPADLVRLLGQARALRADAVWGIRQRRGDSAWRLLISRSGRWIKRLLLGGTAVQDTGCGIWVARRRHLVAAIRACPAPAGQVHCHLPDLIARQGGIVAQCPIVHLARRAGQAKFGFINRLGPGWRSILQARRARAALRT
jgi:dolichol-phosphate mannosyltransferase